MPPRRRRTGARPGQLSNEFREAVAVEAQRLRDLGDPIEVIRGVADAFAAMDRELEQFAQVRLDAIRDLREEGYSYDRIALTTGLSKGRVAQLVRQLPR